MSIQDFSNSLSIKHQKNVAFTSAIKDSNQEKRLLSNPHLIVSKQIPAEEWQSLTPAQAIALFRVRKHIVKLTIDTSTGTLGNEKAFYADYSQDINNVGYSGYITNFLVIPNHAQWEVVIYEDNGSGTAPNYSKEINAGKGVTWDFDPSTGILWLENGDTLDSFIKPFWVVGYTFIGKTLDIFKEHKQTFDNLIINSSFEHWIENSNLPDEWLSGGDAVTKDTNGYFNTNCLKFDQVAGDNCWVYQYPNGFKNSPTDEYHKLGPAWENIDICFSVYAKATSTNKTLKLRIYDGISITEQLFTVTSSWQRYNIIHRINSGADRLVSYIAPEIIGSPATKSVVLYVDGVMLSVGSALVPWETRKLDDTYNNYMYGDLITKRDIYTFGKIGIGTTAPTQKLDVRGTVKVLGGTLPTEDGLFLLGGVGTGKLTSSVGNRLSSINTYYDHNAIEIVAGTTVGYQSGIIVGARSFDGTGTDAVSFYTRSVERMRIDLNGNVGIATNNPLQKFDVRGKAIISDNVAVGKTTIENWDTSYKVLQVGGIAAIISVANESNGTSYLLNNAYYDGAWKPFTGSGSGNAALFKMSSNGFTFYFNSSLTADTGFTPNEVMFINSNGILKLSKYTINNVPYINSSNQFTTSSIYTDGTKVGIGTISPRKILDVVGDAIVSSSVGIGTTNPSATLHVNGNQISGNLELRGIDSNYNGGLRIVTASDSTSVIALGCAAGGSGTQAGQWNILRRASAASYALDFSYNLETNIMMHLTSDGKLFTNGYIRPGIFTILQTNTGEAWLGRASDESQGSLSIQLGGANENTGFRIVDRAWTKTIFNVSGAAPESSLRISQFGVVNVGTNLAEQWNSVYKVLQIGTGLSLFSTTTSGAGFINSNTYINSSFQYVARYTGGSTHQEFGYDFVSWFIAPPVSAGNLLGYKEKMSLTANSLSLDSATAAGIATTPFSINLGKTYSNTKTMDTCKIFLYKGTAGDCYGFGIGNEADVQYHTGSLTGRHDFYNGNNLCVSILNINDWVTIYNRGVYHNGGYFQGWDNIYVNLTASNASHMSTNAYIDISVHQWKTLKTGASAIVSLDENGNLTLYKNASVVAGSQISIGVGNTIWHSGNMGAGSGLNADLLDTYHGSNYLGKNGNAYYQADTWIQIASNYGIYNPNSGSGTEFSPSTKYYGSYQIVGSKNDWAGIVLSNSLTSATFMSHTLSSSTGVFQQSNNRWQWHHDGSNLYIGRPNIDGNLFIAWHTGNLVGLQEGHYHNALHAIGYEGIYWINANWVSIDGTYRWRLNSNYTDPSVSVAHSDFATFATNANTVDGYHLGGQTNWFGTNNDGVGNNCKDAVVGMLAWRNYGNNYVIFDASKGLSPIGTVINNTNSQVVWIPTYPTLMGWNGANTFGVRVDSARVADYASSAGATAGTLTINGTTYNGSGNVSLTISTDAGTSQNIASTIVKRDANGGFFCGSISSNNIISCEYSKARASLNVCKFTYNSTEYDGLDVYLLNTNPYMKLVDNTNVIIFDASYTDGIRMRKTTIGDGAIANSGNKLSINNNSDITIEYNHTSTSYRNHLTYDNNSGLLSVKSLSVGSHLYSVTQTYTDLETKFSIYENGAFQSIGRDEYVSVPTFKHDYNNGTCVNKLQVGFHPGENGDGYSITLMNFFSVSQRGVIDAVGGTDDIYNPLQDKVLFHFDADSGFQVNKIQIGQSNYDLSSKCTIDINGNFNTKGYIVVGSPSGGNKGLGTINAVAVYDDNVLLTKYALDYFLNTEFSVDNYTTEIKAVDKFLQYANMCGNLDEYNKYVLNNRILPSFADIELSKEVPSVGLLSQRCWEELEIKTIHIMEIFNREKQLELEVEELKERVKQLENK